MQKHVLVLTTTVAFLACGAIAAGAQAPAPTPSQQNATTQPIPSGPMMQQRMQDQAQGGEGDPDGGMMGMMGRGYRHHGCHGGHGMVGMRIIFSLMDADGDGTVSLQEFQAAQERIFRAVDADHDGTVTCEEMRDLMARR